MKVVHQRTISSAAALILASFTIISAGAAQQDYVHVGYQPYTKGDPNTGTNPAWDSYSYQDVLGQMQLINTHFTALRTWTIQYSNQHVIPAAHACGVKVAMGAWGFPSTSGPDYFDEAKSKAEIDSIVAQAKHYQGTVATIICGNENLQDSPNPNGLTKEKIQLLMNYARAQLNANGLTGVKVTTCQTDGVWIGHASLADCPGCDEIWCTIYPFWHGDDPGGAAISYFQNMYGQVVGIAKGKRVVVGETGWATAGGSTWWNGTVKPSEPNAKTYFDGISNWLTSHQVEAYLFEMFDEPWKYTPNQKQESHFGIFEGWNHNRQKYVIPSIKSATQLSILPGLMTAGQGLSYVVDFSGQITQPFDFYLIASAPSGIYTLFLNGDIARGVVPLYRRVPSLSTSINSTVTLRGVLPNAFAGKEMTFYCGAVAAGKSPGVPLDQLSQSSPNMILFDTQTVTVQ
ncbi:MAG: glycosyl hydrolase family 17 protein [Candidatus Aureabacteria bacterium]|nr:glycosyl hydrolase family 17 protein [Candidatus Auribacterota bacterium]